MSDQFALPQAPQTYSTNHNLSSDTDNNNGFEHKPTSYPIQAVISKTTPIISPKSTIEPSERHEQKEIRTIGHLEKSSVKHLVKVTESGGLSSTLSITSLIFDLMKTTIILLNVYY